MKIFNKTNFDLRHHPIVLGGLPKINSTGTGGMDSTPLILYAFTQHKTHKQSAKLKIFSIYRWFLGQKNIFDSFYNFLPLMTS